MNPVENCIFCKIAAGEIPSAKVYESENVLAFLDIAPMEKGHALAIPKRHWASLADVSTADPADAAAWEELCRVVRVLAKAALAAGATGANVLQCTGGSAGQTVGHLHFHVIPRYGGTETHPRFESGAARYADDAERDATAAALRREVARVLAAEGR